MTRPSPQHTRVCSREGCEVRYVDRGPASGIKRSLCSQQCQAIEQAAKMEATMQAKVARLREVGPPHPSTQPKRKRLKPGKGFAAASAQRAKVKDKACLVCAQQPCHPAHLLDRSLGGGDEPEAVVPLCPTHHRQYDEEQLDLLPYLEPFYRTELAYAVQRHGLLRTLKRVTGLDWAPKQGSIAA